jgi:myo-inositol-1(or 4)-monophosphatase
MTFQIELDFLIKTCRDAGPVAREYANNLATLCINRKDDACNSVVTEADLALDSFLKERLCNFRPEFGWLSEETEDDPGRLDKKEVWVVDPIDGTGAFVKGSKDFSISAALCVDGNPVAGVVYLPMRDFLVAASIESGVQIFGEGPEKWTPQTCLVSRNEMKDGETPAEMFPELELAPFSSAATKMALVGAGYAGVTVQRRPKSEWDVAAGDMICRAAGLVVTDLAGNTYSYNKKHPDMEGIIVAPVTIHAELLKTVPPKSTSGYRFA